MTRRQAISTAAAVAGAVVGIVVVGGIAYYVGNSSKGTTTVTSVSTAAPSTVTSTATSTSVSTATATTTATTTTTGSFTGFDSAAYNPVPDSFWSTSNPLYPDHPVTLKFWRSGGFPHDDIVATVTNIFPNITIEATDSQDESQILSVAETGNYVYDMFRIQQLNFEGMIASGNVIDLAQYGFTQWNGNWPDWVKTNMAGNFGTPGTNLYAVPEDSGPNCYIYREDLFSKYNLTVPTTWDEFAT